MADKPVVEIKVKNSDNTTATSSTSTVQNFLKKFTSRKFIMSLVGVIIGILGMLGANDNTIAIVAFAALEILSILAYIIMEGHVDAKAVQSATDTINAIINMINQMNSGEKVTTPETKPSDELLDTLPTAVAYSMAHPESKVMITVENKNDSITLESIPNNTSDSTT